MDLLSDLIRAKAENVGSPADMSEAVAVLIRGRVEVRDGTVKVLDGAGNVRVGGGPHYGDMSLDELLSEVAAERPALFGKVEAPVAPPAPKVPEAPPAPNPYAPATINRTRQAILEARDPQLAAKLKTEAAAVPAFLINRP